MDRKAIHETNKKNAKDLIRCETALIEGIEEVERHRLYEDYKLTSSFNYCVKVLELSEDRAWTYTNIAKKAMEVPAIKTAIEDNKITITNARKLITVINETNQAEWLEKASHCSSRELEKEIAKEKPKEAIKERVKAVAPDLFEFKCALTSKGNDLLARALDILSTQHKKNVDRGEAIEAVLEEFVERHDPVKQAERASKRKQAPVARRKTYKKGKRTSVPKAIQHAVTKETQGQCTSIDAFGERCTNRRFLHQHHKKQVCQGGEHVAPNITVLCSGHHRLAHDR